MKRLICVELYEEHSAANYYAIRFMNEADPLIDQFVDTYNTPEFESDLMAIGYWLEKIGERGALERYFRPEGHPKVKAIPVPPPASKLRLYCFRLDEKVLIFGGGKKKTTRAFQDDVDLAMHVKIVRTVGSRLLKYIEHGQTTKQGKFLTGRLTFEVDL
jgi:hypothetical protein